MVYFVRTGKVAPGKFMQAREWAVSIAEYLNSTFAEVNIQVLENVGGPVWQVHWMSSYDSLAQYETVMAKLVADTGYLERLGAIQNDHLFTDVSDGLYHNIS